MARLPKVLRWNGEASSPATFYLDLSYRGSVLRLSHFSGRCCDMDGSRGSHKTGKWRARVVSGEVPSEAEFSGRDVVRPQNQLQLQQSEDDVVRAGRYQH